MRLEDIGELFGDSVEPLSLDTKHEEFDTGEKAQSVQTIERVS